MNKKEIEHIFLVTIAIICTAILINVIGTSYTGYSIYNYTGNDTTYEMITPDNYDKILTSDKGVIDYNIIDKGKGDSYFDWKDKHGFISICNSDIENCEKELNETTSSYWYLTRNLSSINTHGNEKSVIEWINEENKTKTEFWLSFEDTEKDKNGKMGDEDFNDVFFELQKKRDILLIKIEHEKSGYKNPSNILFKFDSDTWFVTYKISKHIYLGGNKWNDSNEEIFEWTGDLEYEIFYDDSEEGQWIQFKFQNITDIGDEDDDKIINEYDNCLNAYNPDQNNSDNDSFGDVCDNCPFVDNENQLDSNNNDIGDVCEPSCNDNIQNGEEDGIDCGGSCPSCVYTRIVEVNQSDTLVNNVKLTIVTTENISNISFNNQITFGNNVLDEENLSIIEIQPDYNIDSILLWMFLEVSYNDSELINRNTNESTIRLYYYNKSWLELNSSLDTENNYLYVNLTYLINRFGLFGDKNSVVTYNPPSGGGGGGSRIPKEETRTLEQAKEIITPETTRILEKKEDLCRNEIKDPDEKGVDCGGSCPECNSIKTILPYTNFMLFILLLMTIMTLIDKGRSWFKDENSNS